MDTWDALYQVATINGPPGHESPAANAVADLWRPYANEVQTDALGNVIAHRHPTRAAAQPAPAILLAAHIDEIALMVAQVEDNGFLRVVPVGGIDLRVVTNREVLVHGRKPLPGIVGALPSALRPESERSKAPSWDDIFVDIGLSGATARQWVQVGDCITFASPCLRLQDERVAGKAFDDRSCTVVIWEALQRLARLSHAVHVYAVGTVQEEVGLRGAIVSAFGIAPQAAIAIDVGFGAMPGVNERQTLTLGKGPGITLGANIHRGLRERLLSIAKAENVPWQMEVAPASSGTDAWGMQVSQAGIPTAVISLPLRYMHSPVECADLADIRTTGRLLAAFLAALEPGEVWGWAHATV